jgi:hypothetical protein
MELFNAIRVWRVKAALVSEEGQPLQLRRLNPPEGATVAAQSWHLDHYRCDSSFSLLQRMWPTISTRPLLSPRANRGSQSEVYLHFLTGQSFHAPNPLRLRPFQLADKTLDRLIGGATGSA